MKLTKEEQKEQAIIKQLHNEKIHSLVLKIISWKSGLVDGAVISRDDLITKAEWDEYQAHLLEISKTDSVEKTKQKIADIKQAIKDNGGFEKGIA